MKNSTQRWHQILYLPFSLSLCALLATMVVAAGTTVANAAAEGSSPVARISAEISNSQMSPLAGSRLPFALAQNESGRLASSTRLEGVSLYFSPTQSQQADLQALIAAQQNPSSPQFHQWLTPEQFASRFGVADSDIAKVRSWLEQQGFSVDSISRSKTIIRFSGTAGQVEAAFATEMHNFTVNGVKHFAPSTELSVPSALAGVVLGVRNLDDFRPKSHLIAHKDDVRAKPAFTSNVSGAVYFAPGDIATVYDIQKTYNAGFTGVGQSIAIVGQSEIMNSDIEAFESAAGLPIKDPTSLLMPGTGSSTIFADGDETESDLDLEWSGAIAKGANIYFVYTGSNTNYGAFDALQYAVDNKVANILSSSYGECETALGGANLETVFAQAATQGQTIMAAAGDDGSTDCYSTSGLSTSQQQALAVDYPASSPYVTGLGGTEVDTSNADYLTPGDGYWQTANGTDAISSALKYIPEVAWNESSAGCGQIDCLSASGGGTSALFAKPSWQTAVPGISTGIGNREVPDVSLNSSPGLPGYLLCTSDQTDWQSGQGASCSSGFRDASTEDLTIAGGTSFAAPIFSGMLAVINQQQNYTTGQGLINPTLYTLAANATTYGSAFHDITSGNNDCPSGSGACGGTVTGFSAGAGYDQVTGLGTIDLYNLANAWPANTAATLIGTTTTVTASNASPALNVSDTFTITVASDTGTTVPSGKISITVDSGTAISETLTANGTYIYTTSFTTAGTHEVLVTYAGDAAHATSTGSASVDVPAANSGSGTFSLSASSVTVSQGSAGASTITITPAGGYLGTVDLSFDTSNDNALQNLCYSFTNNTSSGGGSAVVSGTTAVTTQLSFDTNASDCATAAAVRKTGTHAVRSMHQSSQAIPQPSGNGGRSAPAALALAGLLFAGFLGRYSRKFRALACLIVLASVALAMSACGGGSSSNTISNPPKGTYTVTITGQDSASATIPTATTTFTFTIQ